MCRAKQTPMKIATPKPLLERLPPKTKTFFAFSDKFAKSSARDENWIQCTQCLLRVHVECVCEYCK